jgi:[calcium/calmodulin-dependent protein kinase] kinase
VHRDIKPQNVLLSEKGEVKLIDFGRAVELSSPGQRLKGSEGTYHFMAPEMLSEVFPDGYDGKSCDMWALGVTFYSVLFETLPFYEELLIKLFEKIEKGDFSFPKKYRPEYARFIPIIKQLLCVESKTRPTAEELLLLLSKLE